MDKWNPMQEDYLSPNFNCYDRGPGALLPSDYLPPYKMKTTQGRPKNSVTLYVTKIPLGLEEEGIRNIFSKFGSVMRVYRGSPKSPRGEPFCFGFVTYSSLQEAESALRELNDKPPYGFRIQFALSPEEKAERDRSKQQECRLYQDYKNSAELDMGNMHHTGCESRPASSLNQAILPLPEEYRHSENFLDLHGTQVSNLTVTAGSAGRLVSCESSNRVQNSTDFYAPSVTVIHDYRHENHSPVVSKEVYDYRCERSANVDRTQVVHFLGSGDKLKRFVHKQHDNAIIGSCASSSNNCSHSGFHHCSTCHSHCGECFPDCHTRHWPQHSNYRCGIPVSSYRRSVQEVGIQVDLLHEGRKFCNHEGVDAYSQTDEYNQKDQNYGLSEEKCIKCSRKQLVVTGTQYYDHDYNTPKDTEYVMSQMNHGTQNDSAIKKFQRNNKPNLFSKIENKSGCNGNIRKSATQRNEHFVKKQIRRKSSTDKNTSLLEKNSSPEALPTNAVSLDKSFILNNQNVFRQPAKDNIIQGKDDSKQKLENKENVKNDARPNLIEHSYPETNTKVKITSKCQYQNATNLQIENLEDCVEVVVCNWSNPNEIWLHKMDKQYLLKNITEQLGTLSGEIKVLQCPSVGDMCGAVYPEDGAWYRARINAVNADGTCEVLYIDFGNKEIVQSSQLIHLPANMLLIQPLAIPCQLANIQPLQGQSTWDSEALEVCGKLIGNKVLKARKIHIGKNNYVDVELINDEGSSIAEIMVASGHAKWIGIVQDKQSYPLPLANDKISSYQTPTQEETEPTTSLQIVETNPSDVSQTPHIEKSTLAASIPSVIDELNAEQAVQLSVTVKEQHGFWAVVAITDMIAAIYKIEEFFTHEQNQVSHYRPKVGEYVAAFSPSLLNWYRAYVLELEDDCCTVLYTDYGNQERVSKTSPLKSDHVTAISPALYCTSNHLPQLEINSQFEGIVKCVNSEVMLLEIMNTDSNSSWQLTCQPWNYSVHFKSLTTSSVKTIETDDCLVTEPQIDKKIDNRIMHCDLKECKFVPEDSFRVIIVWAKSAGELYVQKCSDHDNLLTMSGDLNELCETLPELSYVPLKDEIVCAKFSLDSVWYRACVLDILTSNNYAVHFVDYGNKEEVTSENIRPLPSNAASYPLFGICVSLEGVPCDTNIPSDLISNSWWFLEIVNTEINPVTVIMKNQHGDTLNSLLMKNKSSIPQKTCDAGEHDQTLTNVIQIKKITDTEESSLQPFPEIAQTFNIKDLGTVELPVAESVKVILKNAMGPNVIFCSPQEESETVAKMKEEMDEFCSKLSEQNLRPIRGELCLAKLNDNHWHRAVAIDEDPVQNFWAVDSGIVTPVSSSNIRNIVNCFAKLPAQVVTCRLTNTVADTVAEKLSEDAFTELITPILNLPLEMNVIEKTEDGVYVIDIPFVNDFLNS